MIQSDFHESSELIAEIIYPCSWESISAFKS